MKTKIKPTTCPPSYFEFNEKRADPHITQVDIVEWDMPDPEPAIIVEESRNNFKVNAVRRAWEKFIGIRS